MRAEVLVKVPIFACGGLIVPTPLVEKSIFPPLNCLCVLATSVGCIYGVSFSSTACFPEVLFFFKSSRYKDGAFEWARVLPMTVFILDQEAGIQRAKKHQEFAPTS